MDNFDPRSIRNGRAWCDVVNKEPLPQPATRVVTAIGKCNRDGSGFAPYDTVQYRTLPTTREFP